MPERGRSPGAKGTAYPRAQRPQKSVPHFASGAAALPSRSSVKSPIPKPPGNAMPRPGDRADAPEKGAVPASLKGKTLHLQKKVDSATFESKPAPRGHPAKRGRGHGVGPRPAPDASLPHQSANKLPKEAAAREADPDALVRISKLMAAQGLCSRREADDYIERGWVLVNGVPVTELGSKARADAVVSLAPTAQQQQNRRMTLLLHKPVGYVSGQPEPGFQPAVVLIQPQNQARAPGDLAFEPRWMKDLAPAGRLDIDSTGLLVLTQDGRIARQLIGEDSDVEKEYLVRVEGRLVQNGLALLNHGLSLDGKALRPAKVEWLNEDQLRFILREGKKRQIRRMCELVGLTVVGLKRVRMGKVKLGDLPLGQWRYLRPDEAF